MSRGLIRHAGFLGLIVILSIPLILPYFSSNYFPTHDGEWAVVRLADMFRTLKDFQFPARYSGALNFGYGYPLFNFAYPFPYYLGVLVYFPFGSFILAIKALFVGSVILSGIFMYMASLQIWKNSASAMISAVLYLYLPYRMVDLYVRGSVGESMSFVLFPLIFYLILRLFESPFNRVTVCSLAFTFGILVMTHNIMTTLFIPLVIAFAIIRILLERRFDVLQTFLLALFLGAGISFFFWFPALFEKGNILLSTIPIADRNLYFVNLSQLIFPSWGYAPPTEPGGFSYQLGVGHNLVMLLIAFIVAKSILQNQFVMTPIKKYATILLGIYLVFFSMMFSFTSFIWENIPLLSEINYPWTILSQLGFLTALIAGFLALQNRIIKYGALILVLLAIILTYPYARPESYIERDDNYYLTNEATTTSSKELMPLWVKEYPVEHFKEKVQDVNRRAEITNLTYSSNRVLFNYKSPSDTVFLINTIYYPGWKAYLNGENIEIRYDNPQGIMEISASQYRNTVLLKFEETLPRTIANTVSILSVLAVLFIGLRPLLLFKSS